ncbi:hypothetical protein Dimus_010283 [Dionaea muscipula]
MAASAQQDHLPSSPATAATIIFCRLFIFLWRPITSPSSTTRDWFFTIIGDSSSGGPPPAQDEDDAGRCSDDGAGARDGALPGGGSIPGDGYHAALLLIDGG